ncbi:MAG: WecB/TagA/CpsF family glycosyltransferase [Anaerolineae bacterium]|nr:WecB/TagA/CpsF family glycosyltransferase [Anaerolineae bacterium]
MRRLIVILGIPIDDLNMEQALDRIEEFIQVGRSTGKTHQIATVNADFVVKAMKDPELRYLLQEADMATADGMPLVWGSRLLGVTLEDRVAGADMVPALAERAAKNGHSLYFLGAAPGIAAQAATMLQDQHPGLIVAGVKSPPYTSVIDMDPGIIDEIKAANPDVLLVAFGNPKQEKWIGMYGRELGVPVMIGIGGTLDFITGNTKRAPEWMQRAGLEWLHRLLNEPRRLWKRYAVDLVHFGTFFLRQWWAMRKGNVPTAVLPDTGLLLVEDAAVLNLQGKMMVAEYEAFNQVSQEALAYTSHIIVNLARAEFLDSSMIGALIGLAKQARDAAGDVLLAAVPPTIMQTLSLLRLDQFFVIVADVNEGLAYSFGEVETAVTIQPPPTTIANNGAHQATDTEAPAKALDADWIVYQAPRRLDAITAPDLTEACCELLASNPYLILDLSETTLLASAGLASLAKINRTAAEQNGALRVTNCSEDVMRVIKMVRFDKILTLYTDVDEALKLN